MKTIINTIYTYNGYEIVEDENTKRQNVRKDGKLISDKWFDRISFNTFDNKYLFDGEINETWYQVKNNGTIRKYGYIISSKPKQ